MKHALLVDTRLDVPGDRRGDASRNPTGPNRPDGGSFLDATSEPDQGIAEMAFQSLSRCLALGDRKGEGRRHPLRLFCRMTIRAGFNPSDR